MKEIQNKATLADIEYKSAEDNSDTLHIRAYALAFNNVDSYGDVILPTALDNFIKSEDFNRMHLCYQHKRDVVIGVIKNAGVDEKGMWIEADILPTTQGKDVQLLIKSGAVREFSIGYWVNKCRFERRDGYQYEIRVLEDIGIYEVSPVTFAANPEAVLIDAKNERENTNHNKSEAMEEKMLEMKQAMESAQKDAMAAKDAVKAMEAEVKSANDTIKEQATQIDNLDASIKAQEAVIKSMQKTMSENKTVTFEEAIKSALVENKDKIEKMFAEKQAGSSVRFDVEVKAGVTATAQAYGTVVDTVVGSAPHAARAFLALFGEEVVAGDKAAWLDGEFTNAADYVEELTAAQDSNATTDEVIRQFGKIATRLLIPSEVQDWMNVVAQWATNEAQEVINDKAEAEVYGGVGNDTNAKKKVYGIKGQATAFAKVATYENANVGDVILDAVAQAKKNGYLANGAIVSFGTEAELKGLKDKNGNYIYNQLTGMFGPVRILPSAVVEENEIFVADSRCAKVLRRPSIEIEITRDADLDGWKVNVRKSVQTKVKKAHKKGIIYVADKTTAIAAINKA
jgi:HK97 family phage prohead protease/HK97 family phage major capsid protein